MTTIRLAKSASSILVAFSLAALLPACASDAEAVCDAKCECENCGPAAYDNCLAEADGDEREADYRGCLDFYDELKACEYETGFCKGPGDFDTGCGPEKDRLKTCQDQKK
jgi:hypothetical protein